jgi:hypothetical protein
VRQSQHVIYESRGHLARRVAYIRARGEYRSIG